MLNKITIQCKWNTDHTLGRNYGIARGSGPDPKHFYISQEYHFVTQKYLNNLIKKFHFRAYLLLSYI